jgi:hypothetical protein
MGIIADLIRMGIPAEMVERVSDAIGDAQTERFVTELHAADVRKREKAERLRLKKQQQNARYYQKRKQRRSAL